MANIRAGKVMFQKVRPYAPVESKRILYETTQDILEKKETVAEVARDFRKRVILPFSDWETGLPSYQDAGYEVLRQTMASYTNYVEKLKPQDAQKFARLSLGESQLNAIENASLKNVDIKLFKDTLEKSMGKTLRSVLIPD